MTANNFNLESGVISLGGKKKGKKSGKRSGKKSSPVHIKQRSGLGFTKRAVPNLGERLSANKVADELQNLRSKMSGGNAGGAHTLLVERFEPMLRLLDNTDPYSRNVRLLGIAQEIMNSASELYPVESEFIDLRENLAGVRLDSNPQYVEVDHQDLLNVVRTLLRQILLKQRPMIKVYDYGRAINKSIKDFAKNLQTSCPPINEPNKNELFYDADGYPACRVPIDKRTAVRGVSKCPTFVGSRRTQLHVQSDGTAVCRMPVRTGAHECPEPIYKDQTDPSKNIYVDPMATVHETLPGGVGICKRPYSIPSVMVSSPSLMPTQLDMTVAIESKSKKGMTQSGEAKMSGKRRGRKSGRRSGSRSGRRSGRKSSGIARPGMRIRA